MAAGASRPLLSIFAAVLLCITLAHAKKTPVKIVKNLGSHSSYRPRWSNPYTPSPSPPPAPTVPTPSPFFGPSMLEHLVGNCSYFVSASSVAYRICPFKNVTQIRLDGGEAPILLGVWAEWKIENETFTSLRYTRGDECGTLSPGPDGDKRRKREVEVEVVCDEERWRKRKEKREGGGKKNETEMDDNDWMEYAGRVMEVDEVEMGVYRAVLATTVVCRQGSLNASTLVRAEAATQQHVRGGSVNIQPNTKEGGGQNRNETAQTSKGGQDGGEVKENAREEEKQDGGGEEGGVDTAGKEKQSRGGSGGGDEGGVNTAGKEEQQNGGGGGGEGGDTAEREEKKGGEDEGEVRIGEEVEKKGEERVGKNEDE